MLKFFWLLSAVLIGAISVQPVSQFFSLLQCMAFANNISSEWMKYRDDQLNLIVRYPEKPFPYVSCNSAIALYSKFEKGNAGISGASVRFFVLPFHKSRNSMLPEDFLIQVAKRDNHSDKILSITPKTLCRRRVIEVVSNWNIGERVYQKYRQVYFLQGETVFVAQLTIGTDYLNTTKELEYNNIFEKMLKLL